MRFRVAQRFSLPVEVVVAAFADPGLYATYADGGTLGRPEVLEHSADGTVVELRLRHRFTGSVSSAVRAVVDPDRLTWVEVSRVDLATGQGSFRVLPDHYADRLRCEGRTTVTADGPGATRTVEGELKVRAPLVAGAVERAIVSGLEEHLRAEVADVEAYARRGAGH